MMVRHFGAVVVDERPFPIIDIYLADGRFHVVFVVRGPSPPIEGREWTVHDPDGGLVYRSIGGRARLNIPEQYGVSLHHVVTLHLSVDDKLTTPVD